MRWMESGRCCVDAPVASRARVSEAAWRGGRTWRSDRLRSYYCLQKVDANWCRIHTRQ